MSVIYEAPLLSFYRSPDRGWRPGEAPHIFKDGGVWCVVWPNAVGNHRSWRQTFGGACDVARSVRG